MRSGAHRTTSFAKQPRVCSRLRVRVPSGDGALGARSLAAISENLRLLPVSVKTQRAHLHSMLVLYEYVTSEVMAISIMVFDTVVGLMAAFKNSSFHFS